MSYNISVSYYCPSKNFKIYSSEHSMHPVTTLRSTRRYRWTKESALVRLEYAVDSDHGSLLFLTKILCFHRVPCPGSAKKGLLHPFNVLLY